MEVYEIRQIEALNYPDEGWVWNDSHVLGTLVTNAEHIRKSFTSWLRTRGIRFKKSQTRIVDDAGEIYEILDRKTDEPLFAMIHMKTEPILKELCDDGAISLVCAIARQAADDYKEAINTLAKGNQVSREKHSRARKAQRQCIEFFESEWFSNMLDLLPDDVINIAPAEFKARLDEDIELVETGMLPPRRVYNNTAREVKSHA